MPNRVTAISDQVRQASDSGAPYAIVVGNSLVERLFLTEVCGLPVVNAGVGRARIADLEEIGRIARASPASLRILSIGVNDISRGASPEQFSEDYGDLVGILEPHIVVGVTGAKREPYNSLIKEIAPSAQFVEPLTTRELQADSVHYTGVGAIEMRRRLEQSCPDRQEA